MGLIEDIKNEAINNGTMIQNDRDRDLQNRLNKLFYLEKKPEKELEFLEMVMTRGQETSERKGLHASAIIVGEENFCLRQQVLSIFYRQLQGEQTPIGLKRIFTEGDSIHEKWQRLFIRGGLIKPLDCDYTLLDKRYDLTFTPDLNNVRIDGDTYVGEIKSVNTIQFKRMVETGEEHESGKKQLMLYLYLTGIKKGFVLCEDKNNQNIKVNVYDYDEKIIEPFIDRLERIRRAKELLVKDGKIPKRHINCGCISSEKASRCPMKNVCFGKSKELLDDNVNKHITKKSDI